MDTADGLPFLVIRQGYEPRYAPRASLEISVVSQYLKKILFQNRTRFSMFQNTIGTLASLEIGQTVRGIRGIFNFLNTEATLLFTTDSVSAHKSRYIMYYSHVRVTPGVRDGPEPARRPLRHPYFEGPKLKKNISLRAPIGRNRLRNSRWAHWYVARMSGSHCGTPQTAHIVTPRGLKNKRLDTWILCLSIFRKTNRARKSYKRLHF